MKLAVSSALLYGFLQILKLVLSSGESVQEDITSDDILILMQSYLNARDLTFKDVPEDVLSLIAKYYNKFTKTDNSFDFIEEEFKKSKHMLLEDEMNNEIFFDLLDYISSTYDDNPIRGATLDALIEKTMEKFPDPVELKFLETEDVMKYLLFIDSHPKVMNAVEDLFNELYAEAVSKTIDDALETDPDIDNKIIDEVLEKFNIPVSEVEPEILELIIGFKRRLIKGEILQMKRIMIPNETELNILKTYQDILTSAVESVLNFLKSPHYIRDTDHWIDNILRRFKVVLSVLRLKDILELWDIISVNDYDFRVLQALRYDSELAYIDNVVNFASSYLPLKSLEDIYEVSKIAIREPFEKYSLDWFFMNVCGMEEADIVGLTEPKFLEVIDNVLRKKHLTVKKLSQELLHLVSKVFHRVEEHRNNPQDYESETLTNDLEHSIKTTFTLIRNRFQKITLPLEYDIDYRNLLETNRPIVIAFIRAAPPKEIVKLFNIMFKDNKLMGLLAKYQMQNRHNALPSSMKLSTFMKGYIGNANMSKPLDVFSPNIWRGF